MQNLNLYLFSLLNADAGLSGLALALAIFMAKYVIYLIPLIWIICWLWGPTKQRGTLLFAVFATIVALLFSYVIGLIWYHPRPFVLGIGHTYLAHAPDSSFPSDHTTFMWAMGLSFITYRGLRALGIGILILGIVVGLARVYVGIHYPFDILGAMLAAGASVSILYCIYPAIERGVLPLVENIYRKLFTFFIKRKWVKE